MADIEGLYRERFPAFARAAISITGDVERGREAVQEAFARAIEQRARFRGDCPLDAWLWRIVINTARTTASRAHAEIPDPSPLATNGASNGHAESSGVELWLRSLPERQRLVVFLRYWADLDYRSIAAVLEIETGTVSATLSAAHRTLRRSLQEVRT